MAPGADPKQIGGQFMHMDRGEDYSDHHSVFVLPFRDPPPSGEAQFHHVSFELQSIDDVFKGHMSFRKRVEEGRRSDDAKRFVVEK